MVLKSICLALLMLAQFHHAQQSVIGTLVTEDDHPVEGVTVVNIRTDARTATDRYGQFIITAAVTDELRFVKNGYERAEIRLKPGDFRTSMKVHLRRATTEIPEISIAFRPTGNLRRDTRALDKPARVSALNNSLNLYMRGKPAEVMPTNRVPAAFAPPNLNAGQVPLLGIGSGGMGGVLGLAAKLLKKKTATSPLSFSEKQQFFAKVKSQVDLAFFYSSGMDEYGLDQFLLYADAQYGLAKMFYKDFNAAQIEVFLKSVFGEYIKTHSVAS